MTEKFIKQGHHLLYNEASKFDVTLGITTREGGQSNFPNGAFNMARYIDDNPQHITNHQKILAEEIKFDRENWVFPIQTHENKVVEITSNDKGTNIDSLTSSLHGIDAMYTYEKNILLTMCYADCVPVYFYSPNHNFIALAHAGWRGTFGQIVAEVIKQVSFDLEQMYVVIGPATSSSYEINDDIRNKFAMLPIDITKYVVQRGNDRHGIDLKLANKLLLEYYGIPSNNIYITDYATSENLNLFFSYRLEQGQTGRMLAFIGQK
ncbi:peptidoglycan editing factor PgeF [Staphylococcus simiae]|uniref:peptidoglycan editing factor PgeF n=1 Tax=Staphylococcus simiae TaxID=308354 RepID=UPI000BA31064|nr:peptidoglycan editing factor PgeF [Staphylococcus simiae]PNZ11946.1 peptidoglycan editing factor PgeF [Staphylococcus simiae]